MKLHKIILLVGITLLTTTANAQQTFDVNLYNMLPEHSNGDLYKRHLGHRQSESVPAR